MWPKRACAARRLRHRALVGDVDVLGQRALRAERRRGLRNGRCVRVPQGDGGARLIEARRDRAAEASGSARDDGRAAGEIVDGRTTHFAAVY